ncbi:MAG TPA: glycine betaine ABC transporter substrate-binding protein, partial [Tepidisphaeraceae bacterium]|nr:glycine betaine ABC transporter substrate-binding protein [Tepidisphaeraceae bacterium]
MHPFWAQIDTGGILKLVERAAIIATNSAQTTVGAKTFTEQYILADLIRAKLEDSGITARKKQGMGTSILFDALANSSVDVYVDYSGTIWSNVMKRTDMVSREEMLDQITIFLKNEYDITCLGSLGFENTYALAMRRDRAKQLGIKTINQLAHVADEMKVGGDYEFFGRPEWTTMCETYDIAFQKRVSLDSTLMYEAVRDGQVDVISAFSTDGRIAAYDLVVLQGPVEVARAGR